MAVTKIKQASNKTSIITAHLTFIVLPRSFCLIYDAIYLMFELHIYVCCSYLRT